MRNRVRVGDRAGIDEALARTRAFESSSSSVSVAEIFGTYAVKPSDEVVLAFGGAYSITLPAPTKGKQITIKDAQGNASTSGSKTILPHGSETIDGATSFIINLNYAAVQLTSDGTNWYVTGTYNGSVV